MSEPMVLRIPSRSGGKDHVVTVIEDKDGEFYLICTCPAGIYAWTRTPRGKGCWAMQQVRKSVGLPPVVEP